jgi:adenylate cyclase
VPSTERPTPEHPERQRLSVGLKRENIAQVVLLLLLLGLPLSVWFDVQNIAANAMQRQATDLNAIISNIVRFYGTEVVSRVQANHGQAIIATHNYKTTPGAIPIPATMALELGRITKDRQTNIDYRFVSDFPFRNRPPHVLDAFETRALATLRGRSRPPMVVDRATSGFLSKVRVIFPIVMAEACVECHNTHPESIKKDWKVEDVRGFQEVSITQETGNSLLSFKFSLTYFLFMAVASLAFIALQRQQNRAIRQANDNLEKTNNFLESVSKKISHYLSPQIYNNIFKGEMDAVLHTQRKNLTIFFSDIKDFTQLTESLQPEALTTLINQYFTAMAEIALKHGGTIDKFIGDAMLIFFGDPESRGAAEDARACLRMAVEMQHSLAKLNVQWSKLGIEVPFRVRMGINTGYCNVGNFGSMHRMDYTIMGAEANLAARLESIAAPGGIVVSYETYALVRDLVTAHVLPSTKMKGIARQVVPYAIDGLRDEAGTTVQVFIEHGEGLDLYLDLGRIDSNRSKSLRVVLYKAIAALDKQEELNGE